MIQADHLEEVDATEIGIIWQNDSEEVVQKYRDVLKSCVIMWDGYITYIFLGVENQSDIHYAMPVKNMIYDALNYGRQVSERAKEHRKEKDLSGDEFLSGFSKTDKLKPVITLTLYFGADEWDAPRCLFDMMELIPPELEKYIDNYRLNLIIPKEIKDFSKFSTELKNVLQFIAASEDKDAVWSLLVAAGYLNRRGFFEEAQALIARRRTLGKRTLILYVDMNNLKIINDRYGHEDGDFSLKTIAQILAQTVENRGVTGRIGGDEYACAIAYDAASDGTE